MTRYEAIEYWEGLRKTFSSQLEKEENHFGRMHLQTTIDALDMAISALRQQETVTKCNDLYDEDGGEILKSETVTNRSRLNEPLTLDEMRDMPCEPVYIVVGCASWWDIVSYAGMEYLYLKVEGSLPFRDYGKNWAAYRQKPEEGTV